jgi:hypothetical protein
MVSDCVLQTFIVTNQIFIKKYFANTENRIMPKPAAKKMKTELNQSPSLHWTAELKELIQNIEPLGSFVHHQSNLTNLPPLTPHVSFDGIGRFGFPIANLLVDALIAKSTKAPYGKLDKTLLNTEVRDAWQIDATMVTVGGGDAWTLYFKKAVRDHCFHLGISKERFNRLGIQASLYKMLIYEEGGHFLTHRDTEKEVNMFGTLILQLPTSEGFTGGDFTVTHQGVTRTFDLSAGSDNQLAMVSFYADCEHELHPITSGKRVCLVYNLVATSAETASIPSHDVNVETENKLRSIATIWKAQDAQNIEKIGYQLEHKYSHQSIGISTLKRRDEIVFATLQNAKNSSGDPLFRVSLLLMESYHNVYGEEHLDRKAQALALIQKVDDGSYTKQQLATAFGMRDWSKKKELSDDDSDTDIMNCDTTNLNVTALGKNDKEVEWNWRMVCMSKGGWWFMKGSNSVCVDEMSDDDDDDKHRNRPGYDGYHSDEDDDRHYISDEEQMFRTPYDIRTREHCYTGNEGGQEETWYYAAAIVISPY